LALPELIVERGFMESDNFSDLLAERTHLMSASAIREILKVVSKPGMISLAGGIPAPESFPIDIIEDLTAKVLSKYGPAAFQYDLTEGFLPFRKSLVEFLSKKGVHAETDEIISASGSQGVLDAVGKILITKGDKVAVEAPTYLGAIQAFNPYEPEYISMATDDDGLIPESLVGTIKNHRIKFIYLVPTFQNPTGRTIPLSRRERIAEIIQEHNVLLIEDDPYSDLRYRGTTIPTIKSMAPGHVVYIGTLSKIFAPGLRLGFVVAPEQIRKWIVLAKQGVDLHTSTFNQALASEYLSGGYLDRQLPKIISLYRPKQEAMLSALDTYFSESFKWSRPEGGMFIWAEGPDGLNMDKVYLKAIEHNTAFVPGKYFFPQPGDGINTMRLNFTMSDEKAINSAIRTLADVISDYL
jgi:2-aminoadipate transaminase